MSLKVGDRIRQNTLSTGVGGVSLVGDIPGFKRFSDVLSSGDITYYVIEENDKFEVGVGIYGSDNLERFHVLSSSNSGNKIELGGSGAVFVTYPADKSVIRDLESQVVVGASGLIFENGTTFKEAKVVELADVNLEGSPSSQYLIDFNTTNKSLVIGESAGPSNSRNTLIGHGAGSGITSGTSNTNIGTDAGHKNEQGFKNVSIGDLAGPSDENASISVSRTVNVGYQAGEKSRDDSVNIGFQAGAAAYSRGHVSIGSFSGSGVGNYAFVGGYEAAHNHQGDYLIAIGYRAAKDGGGESSVWVGKQAGQGTSSAINSIGIGELSGQDSSGNNSIYLGKKSGKGNTLNDMLFVAGNDPTSEGTLIKGDFNTKRLAVGKSDVTLSDTFYVGVNSSTDNGIVVQGASLQSSDLTQWRTYDGQPIASVSSSGTLLVNGLSASGQGLRLDSSTPIITGETLYNVNGSLYWNGASLSDQISYASGLAIVNEADIAYVSGIIENNTSDDAYVSGIAVYSSGQVIANKVDISYVSGVAVYASGNVYDDTYISGVAAYSSGVLVDGGTLIPDADKGIAIAKGVENFPVTITQDDNSSGGAHYIRLRDNDTDNITLGATDLYAFQITASGEGSSDAENVLGFSSVANDDRLVFGGSTVPTKVLGSNVTVNAEGSVELQRGGSTRVKGDSAFTYLFGQTGGYIFYGANALKPQSATSIALGGASNYWGSLYSSDANLKGSAATNVPLTIDSQPAQSANLAEFKANDGVVVAQVAPDGSIATSGDISVSGTLIVGELKSPQDTGGYLRLRGSNDTYIDVSDGTMNFYCNTGQAFRLTSSFVDVFKTLRPISNQDLGRTTNRWPNLYAVNGDFSNTVSASGVTASGTVTANTIDTTWVRSGGNLKLLLGVNGFIYYDNLRPNANGTQSVGLATQRFGNFYGVDGDFSNTVSSSGVQASGMLLYSHTPTDTSNKLYNNGGTLMFNGSAVDSGQVSGSASGVAFFGNDGLLTDDSSFVFNSGSQELELSSISAHKTQSCDSEGTGNQFRVDLTSDNSWLNNQYANSFTSKILGDGASNQVTNIHSALEFRDSAHTGTMFWGTNSKVLFYAPVSMNSNNRVIGLEGGFNNGHFCSFLGTHLVGVRAYNSFNYNPTVNSSTKFVGFKSEVFGTSVSGVAEYRHFWATDTNFTEIGNSYGMYIEEQTKGATGNYSIYTAGGLSEFNGRVSVVSDSSTQVPFAVNSAVSQSANLTEWKASDDVVIAQVSPDGSIATSGDISVSGALIADLINTTGDTLTVRNNGAAAINIGSSSRITCYYPVLPDNDGTKSLGLKMRRWSDFYSVDGSFTGDLSIEPSGSLKVFGVGDSHTNTTNTEFIDIYHSGGHGYIVTDQTGTGTEQNLIVGQKSQFNLEIGQDNGIKFRFGTADRLSINQLCDVSPLGANKRLGTGDSDRWNEFWSVDGNFSGSVSGARGFFESATTTDSALTITSAASQTANLQEWRASDNVVIAQVEPDGSIASSGDISASGTVTAPLFEANQKYGFSGDTNTFISNIGGSDWMGFTVGGLTWLSMNKASTDRYSWFNPNQNQTIAFRVGYNGGRGIDMDGANGNVLFGADVSVSPSGSLKVFGSGDSTNGEWLQMDHGVTHANISTISNTENGDGTGRHLYVKGSNQLRFYSGSNLLHWVHTGTQAIYYRDAIRPHGTSYLGTSTERWTGGFLVDGNFSGSISGARGYFETTNTTETPLTITSAVSQTANLQEWRASDDVVIARVEPDGSIASSGNISASGDVTAAGLNSESLKVFNLGYDGATDSEYLDISTGGLYTIQPKKTGSTSTRSLYIKSGASGQGEIALLSNGTGYLTWGGVNNLLWDDGVTKIDSNLITETGRALKMYNQGTQGSTDSQYLDFSFDDSSNSYPTISQQVTGTGTLAYVLSLQNGDGNLQIKTNGGFNFKDGASDLLIVAAGAISSYRTNRPANNGYIDLGASSYRWKDTYSVNGDFSGSVSGARGFFESSTTTDSALTITSAASQTANLTEWKNSSDETLTKITSDGSVHVSGNIVSEQVGEIRNYILGKPGDTDTEYLQIGDLVGIVHNIQAKSTGSGQNRHIRVASADGRGKLNLYSDGHLNYFFNNNQTFSAFHWGISVSGEIRNLQSSNPSSLGQSTSPFANVYSQNGSFSGDLNIEPSGSQKFYNLGTDGDTDTEFVSMSWDSNDFKLLTDKTGTGTIQDLDIAGKQVALKHNSGTSITTRLSVDSNSVKVWRNLYGGTDGLYNCGLPANRWLGVYSVNGDFSGDVTTGTISGARGFFESATTTDSALTITSAVSQTANLQEWKASDEVNVATVAPDGSIASSGNISASGSITTNNLTGDGTAVLYIDQPISTSTVRYRFGGTQYWHVHRAYIHPNVDGAGDIGQPDKRIGSVYVKDSVHSSGVQASGLFLQSHVPTVTTNTLYNDGGTLMFNGSAVGGGGGSVTGTPSGIAFFGDDGSLTDHTDFITSSGTNGRRIGINSVANPAYQLTVGNQLYNGSAVVDIRNYSRGNSILQIVATSGGRSANIKYSSGSSDWYQGHLQASMGGLGSRFVVASYELDNTKPLVYDSNGDFVIGGMVPSARLTVNSRGTTVVNTAFKATASQTANMAEWRASDDVVIAHVSADGSIASSGTVSATNLNVFASGAVGDTDSESLKISSDGTTYDIFSTPTGAGSHRRIDIGGMTGVAYRGLRLDYENGFFDWQYNNATRFKVDASTCNISTATTVTNDIRSDNHRPLTDKTYDSGETGYRWANFYAASGSFSNSVIVNHTGIVPTSPLDVYGDPIAVNRVAASFKSSSGSEFLRIYNGNSDANPVCKLLSTNSSLSLYNGVTARRSGGNGTAFSVTNAGNETKFRVDTDGEVALGSSASLYTYTNLATLDVIPKSTSFPGIAVIANASQTANLQEWKASDEVNVVTVAPDGSIASSGNISASGNITTQGELLTDLIRGEVYFKNNASNHIIVDASDSGNNNAKMTSRGNRFIITAENGFGNNLGYLVLNGEGGTYLQYDGADKLSTTSTGVSVDGHFTATSKSFLIDHPTKKDAKLQYASLEGPEHGVYVRGRVTENVIELPDHWVGLVDEESITVQLTAKGHPQPNMFVSSIVNNKVYISSDVEVDAFYNVYAERKDVDKLEVEIWQ